jgi:hypothetical protein
MGRMRIPRESGLKVFVARNLGAMTCGECGRVLMKTEIVSVWRLHWSPPLCFDCMPAPTEPDPEIAAEFANLRIH